ncbi:MAG TPA: PQQ-dependent sugar dehydrogenase [Gaiellaceae bacterium]|nr:PQQ-dependent sugar dehydrogenase [Gaiellaceae bacterium]
MGRLGAAAAAIALVVAFSVGLAWARTAAPGDPQLELVGRFSSPVYLTAPAGDRERLFVVEQAGRIRIVRNGVTLPSPFLDIASLVLAGGERGLLSLAFPPDYASSGRFYVYYTARSPSGAVTIAEYRASGDAATPGSARIVLQIPHSRSNHNGGQLQFGPDGRLYVGTGDGGGAGDPDRAGQRLDTLAGKILRIDPRQAAGAPYTVPRDNPFADRPDARGEIWSYGLRNPWRFSFDRQTGNLAIADVGQRAWEEIDFAPAPGRGRGVNYGWGCWEGRHVYEPNDGNPECSPPPAQTPPAHEYSHSRGCSITGGYVVRDPALPSLAGRYVYGDYCDRRLWSVRLGSPNAQDDRQLGLSVLSLTSFGEDGCGRVYAVSGEGPVYRLRGEGAAPPAGCPAARPAPAIRCRVPRVIALRLSTARTRIRRANCRVGRVRQRRSARARGRVLTQSPRAGARRPRGTRVHLTVSRGT